MSYSIDEQELFLRRTKYKHTAQRRNKIQRKHRRGKHMEILAFNKMMDKCWSSISSSCVISWNATRQRHGYQHDRSFLPLGLKQEHLLSQDWPTVLLEFHCGSCCFCLLCSRLLHFIKQSCSWKTLSCTGSLTVSY